MAIDEAIMAHARLTGERVLRLYEWSQPTVSFGRNQPARDAYDRVAMHVAGVDVVRRPTGGRALWHGPELTYAMSGPAADSLTNDYATINELLLRALHAMGVNARLADAPAAHRAPDETPCFAEPAAGEIVAGGRKLVGSAQYREDGAFLQHGSLLLQDAQAQLAAFTSSNSRPVPAATLLALLARAPTLTEFGDALLHALAEEGQLVTPIAVTELPQECLFAARERHRAPAWIWRR